MDSVPACITGQMIRVLCPGEGALSGGGVFWGGLCPDGSLSRRR